MSLFDCSELVVMTLVFGVGRGSSRSTLGCVGQDMDLLGLI